jgi:DNA mismatch repair protein MutL
VDELFANLPARRKFLKSAAGELRRGATILREYAICRPEVGFALEHDGKSVFSTDGGGDRRRAIEQFWGAEPEIFTARASAGHVELECWWQPRQGRNDVASFVNGRAVSDPLIKGALNSAARELTGGWVLFLSIDPSLIDVNIHPAKAEIRFRRPGDVFDAVKEATSQLGAPAPVYISEGRTFSTNSANLPWGHRKDPPMEPNSRAEGWDFKSDDSGQVGFENMPGFGGNAIEGKAFEGKAFESKAFENRPGGSGTSPSSGLRTAPFQASDPDKLFGRVEMPDFGQESEADDLPTSSGDTVYLGQLSSGYLAFDTPEGLAVVDPHAAHERVAFERIQAAAKTGERSQKLLIPMPLPPTLQLEAEEKRDVLEAVGFVLETMDGGLRLTGVPYLANTAVPPESLLRGSLAALREGGDAEPVEILWRNWATMACKEAVKVTTKLSAEEALALWRDLLQCRQPFFCPHGRPTTLLVSSSALTKHFGRE